MTRDLKYFMRKEEPDKIVTVNGPKSFIDEKGNVLPLEIRVLSQAEITHIHDNYTDRAVATDAKGQPYIANGEVVFKTEKDGKRAFRHIIAEALVYPNLKAPELMKHYGCVDISEMALHVFSRADEYAHVSRMVSSVLGIGEPLSDDDLVTEAKN